VVDDFLVDVFFLEGVFDVVLPVVLPPRPVVLRAGVFGVDVRPEVLRPDEPLALEGVERVVVDVRDEVFREAVVFLVVLAMAESPGAGFSGAGGIG